MTTLKIIRNKKIGFKLTESLFKKVNKKVGEGNYHSRADYMRTLIRRDNSI